MALYSSYLLDDEKVTEEVQKETPVKKKTKAPVQMDAGSFGGYLGGQETAETENPNAVDLEGDFPDWTPRSANPFYIRQHFGIDKDSREEFDNSDAGRAMEVLQGHSGGFLEDASYRTALASTNDPEELFNMMKKRLEENELDPDTYLKWNAGNPRIVIPYKDQKPFVRAINQPGLLPTGRDYEFMKTLPPAIAGGGVGAAKRVLGRVGAQLATQGGLQAAAESIQAREGGEANPGDIALAAIGGAIGAGPGAGAVTRFGTNIPTRGYAGRTRDALEGVGQEIGATVSKTVPETVGASGQVTDFLVNSKNAGKDAFYEVLEGLKSKGDFTLGVGDDAITVTKGDRLAVTRSLLFDANEDVLNATTQEARELALKKVDALTKKHSGELNKLRSIQFMKGKEKNVEPYLNFLSGMEPSVARKVVEGAQEPFKKKFFQTLEKNPARQKMFQDALLEEKLFKDLSPENFEFIPKRIKNLMTSDEVPAYFGKQTKGFKNQLKYFLDEWDKVKSRRGREKLLSSLREFGESEGAKVPWRWGFVDTPVTIGRKMSPSRERFSRAAAPALTEGIRAAGAGVGSRVGVGGNERAKAITAGTILGAPGALGGVTGNVLGGILGFFR